MWPLSCFDHICDHIEDLSTGYDCQRWRMGLCVRGAIYSNELLVNVTKRPQNVLSLNHTLQNDLLLVHCGGVAKKKHQKQVHHHDATRHIFL